jgi:hypothetical protein
MHHWFLSGIDHTTFEGLFELSDLQLREITLEDAPIGERDERRQRRIVHMTRLEIADVRQQQAHMDLHRRQAAPLMPLGQVAGGTVAK